MAAPWTKTSMIAALLALLLAGGVGRADDEAPEEPTPATEEPAPVAQAVDEPAPAEPDTDAAPEPEAVADGDKAAEDEAAPVEVASADRPLVTEEGAAEAAATEAPVEAAPLPRFDARPPFSLSDCLVQLARTADAIPRDGEPERFQRESISRAIESIIAYLKTRDDLNSSLAHYRWRPIEQGIVARGPLDSVDFIFRTPEEVPRQVTALSFEVQRGDALLHYLAIHDEEGELVADFPHLKTRPATLRHSLPRREVFHLWRPTDIGRIELSYSRVNPAEMADPLVVVHAGTTNRPEHGKAAVFFLTRAEQRLQQGHFDEARQDIAEAREAITHWSRQRTRR